MTGGSLMLSSNDRRASKLVCSFRCSRLMMRLTEAVRQEMVICSMADYLVGCFHLMIQKHRKLLSMTASRKKVGNCVMADSYQEDVESAQWLICTVAILFDDREHR